MSIEQAIAATELLEVIVDDAAKVAKEDQHGFAMLRRAGLGASDASVLLGVNLYTSREELIKQKRSVQITQEEIDIGNLENVRRGRDLEPIILGEFAERFGIDVHKPKPMYKVKEEPSLIINFDGVVQLGEELIPVEAKYVSRYAKRYWNKAAAIKDLYAVAKLNPITNMHTANLKEHIEECAKLCGIPPYYYTQVQQQMLGLNAPFGYLASLWDAGWEYLTFAIPKDEVVQRAIKQEGKHTWTVIKTLS